MSENVITNKISPEELHKRIDYIKEVCKVLTQPFSIHEDVVGRTSFGMSITENTPITTFMSNPVTVTCDVKYSPSFHIVVAFKCGTYRYGTMINLDGIQFYPDDVWYGNLVEYTAQSIDTKIHDMLSQLYHDWLCDVTRITNTNEDIVELVKNIRNRRKNDL